MKSWVVRAVGFAIVVEGAVVAAAEEVESGGSSRKR